MDNNEVVFECIKCEHHLFVENISLELIDKVSGMDCPNCGQRAYGNWILVGLGNSEKQRDDFNWE
ncbi:hypothetical protein NSQ20_11890 [Paenibacillus sp. FSL K6-1122]|uniref:hypothetical protein n=1 Tax=Paenibacillus sp. FSL K6-1122 TaxID=2954512 RepID=UPI0030EBCAF9